QLIVSDNGQQGAELERLVEQHYPKPFVLRRNAETVPVSEHFSLLVDAADGAYFVPLADDDELSPGFVTQLVRAMEESPDIGVALARLEVIDENGQISSRPDKPTPPARMSCLDFVRGWCEGTHDYVCFATFLARTEDIRRVGKYPVFPTGTSIDNGLLLKLALGRSVAYVVEETFRYRVYETSLGLALNYRELAADLNAFIDWLDSDETLQTFARKRPREWTAIRAHLVSMTWRTYRLRWKTMYWRRLSRTEWLRAAFALRFIPAYYRSVLGVLVKKLGRRAVRGLRR
ncbi:MAG: glycosyltransferase, partial [Gemmatimonadetes bacterium]|nr:glycosyltransferase [Gemmatimonadota bacterium]